MSDTSEALRRPWVEKDKELHNWIQAKMEGKEMTRALPEGRRVSPFPLFPSRILPLAAPRQTCLRHPIDQAPPGAASNGHLSRFCTNPPAPGYAMTDR